MAILPSLPDLPDGLLTDLYRDPTYALETLALAAVDIHGSAAQEWMARQGGLRHDHRALAASVAKGATRRARVEGAALGAGGVVTMVPDMIALTWIITREIIFIAAAMGHDPTDPQRAAEILVISEIYETLPAAQAGLDRRGERLALALAKQQLRVRSTGGRRQRSMTERMARMVGQRVARRFGGRLVPGLGALLGSFDNAYVARTIGQRAINYYTTLPKAHQP